MNSPIYTGKKILREKRQQLSTGERRILFSARQILASEIALVKNIPLEQAETLLQPLE